MLSESFLSREQPPLNQSSTTGRFAGYKVLVTGGASGIGRAVVERFINDGATVGILDANKAGLDAVVDDLKQQGFQAVLGCHGDVTKPESCKAACSQLADWCPQEGDGRWINCLVNCACTFLGRGLDATNQDWALCQEVNVTGYFNTVQAALPFMRLAPEGRRAVVNLSSAAAYSAYKGRWTYVATKGAIVSLSRGMSVDLGAAGVRVNSVSPGYIWSPEQAKVSPDGTRAGMADRVSRYSALGREGNTSEVAGVVTFLCSRDAGFVTGADLLVDGGYRAMTVDSHETFAGCVQPSSD
ncbi:hypothetical protein BOX15_Mlig025916g1 [Macrostomum lignano]|uniref:NAD(P)-binding protein n=2 Tax=Macrostomum lignano TaxID=282301 RepID=A0A1I8J1B2_9PLAT|nr:hypothetical protein BOX15_Mlig025916g1 [Macrostomum lignano]